MMLLTQQCLLRLEKFQEFVSRRDQIAKNLFSLPEDVIGSCYQIRLQRYDECLLKALVWVSRCKSTIKRKDGKRNVAFFALLNRKNGTDSMSVRAVGMFVSGEVGGYFSSSSHTLYLRR